VPGVPGDDAVPIVPGGPVILSEYCVLGSGDIVITPEQKKDADEATL